MARVTILSGLFAKGPAAVLVEAGGVRLLLDLGRGPEPGAEVPLQGVGRVDALLLTHGHVDHAGALERLGELGQPPVWATAELRALRDLPGGGTLPLRGTVEPAGVRVRTGRAGREDARNVLTGHVPRGCPAQALLEAGAAIRRRRPVHPDLATLRAVVAAMRPKRLPPLFDPAPHRAAPETAFPEVPIRLERGLDLAPDGGDRHAATLGARQAHRRKDAMRALAGMLAAAPGALRSGPASAGKLVRYTSQPTDRIEIVLDMFRTVEPGIEIEMLRSGAAEVVDKLAAEFAAGMGQLEPAMEEAAAGLGARPLRRLLDVHLPLLVPAVAAGALLVFVTALNELTVSALLWSTGNETLGVVVFMLYDEGNSGGAAAVGTVAVLLVLALAALASALARRAGLPRGVLPWQG